MTQNLKIEVLTGDISIDGMVVTNLVTKEELSTAIVKKADLGTDGKIPTSQLPAEIVNTVGIVDEVKLQLETSIKDAVDESNAYAESYTDNALSSKADLTSGKVPLEQLPAIDQYPQFGTALSNLSTSILTSVKQRTDQLEKIKADLGEDGKVLREQIPSYEKISGLPEQLEVMSAQTAAVSKELGEHKVQTADQIDTLKGNIEANVQQLSDRQSHLMRTYATKELGVDAKVGVKPGEYFYVRSTNEEEMLVEYQNVGGSAVATGKRYLSALGVQQQEKPTSTIKDASGKWQQEVNDNTINFIGTSVTPEMFFIAGEANWDNAFVRAQEASNHIILQNGKTYNITKVIRNKSGVTWDLNGAKIVNLRTDPSTFNHHVFTLGNMHPACFNYPNQGTGQYLPCFNVNNIPIGSDFVTLSDSSKASRFNVGQFAWVRTTAEVYSLGDANIPNYAQLVKVKKITGANIFFETTISEAIANACISPIGETTDPATGLKWHIVENVTIKNGVLDARYGAWTRTGMYKCKLDDINVQNGDGTFALNATCHSKLSNISGDFCVRALELKCNSHDTEIFDLNSTFSPKSGVAMLAGLDIGEQSRNIKVYRPRVHVGTDIGGATAIGVPLDVRGRNIQIVDGEFSNCADTPTVTGNVAYIRDALFEGFGTEGVKLINTRLKGSGKRTHLLRVGDTTSSIKAKNTEIDVSYDGQANIAQASYQSEVLITKPTAGQAGQVPSTGVAPRVLGGEIDLNFFNFALYSGAPELINFSNGKAWGLDKDTDEFVVTTINVPSWATVADITGYFVNTANSVGDVSLRLQSATGGRGGTIGTAASFDKALSNAGQNIINAVNFNNTVNAVSNGVMVIRVGRRGSDSADTLSNDIGFIGLSVLFR